MDVINAAKKISEAGTKLDNLATKIADQVIIGFLLFLNVSWKKTVAMVIEN